MQLPDCSLFLQSGEVRGVSTVGKVASARQLLLMQKWGPIRMGCRSTPASATPHKRRAPMSTRRKLQLMLHFPSRSPGRSEDLLHIDTTHIASAPDFAATFSKRLQRTPESLRAFKSPVDRLALTRGTRRPKILKTLGVIKGIKSALIEKTKKGDSDKRGRTPGRTHRSAKPGKVHETLFTESPSDTDDPSPWEYLTSKYTPLPCSPTLLMYTLASGLWSWMFSKRTLTVLVLGVDGAGKTVQRQLDDTGAVEADGQPACASVR